MDVAFIEHAEDDVDDDDRGGDEKRLTGQRLLDCLRSPLKLPIKVAHAPITDHIRDVTKIYQKYGFCRV
jgi:hypothetical protein